MTKAIILHTLYAWYISNFSVCMSHSVCVCVYVYVYTSLSLRHEYVLGLQLLDQTLSDCNHYYDVRACT